MRVRVNTYVVKSLAGTVEFTHEESTEGSFDYLEFWIDGVMQQEWSGINAAAMQSYPIAAGAHTLEWRYTKDVCVPAHDRAQLEDVAPRDARVRVAEHLGEHVDFHAAADRLDREAVAEPVDVHAPLDARAFRNQSPTDPARDALGAHRGRTARPRASAENADYLDYGPPLFGLSARRRSRRPSARPLGPLIVRRVRAPAGGGRSRRV